MQYRLYVHRDWDTGVRASSPNFPRAVAHGNSTDRLKSDAQEAVELAYHRSGQPTPVPPFSKSESHVLDMGDGKGIWAVADINRALVTSQAVGIQFSLPESLLQQVDLAARGRHITRAALITLAVVHELASRYEGQLSSMPVSQRVFVDG